MICPKCKSEYNDGIEMCPECKVMLEEIEEEEHTFISAVS